MKPSQLITLIATGEPGILMRLTAFNLWEVYLVSGGIVYCTEEEMKPL